VKTGNPSNIARSVAAIDESPSRSPTMNASPHEDFFRIYFRNIELGELDVAELRFRSVRAMP
jgi:hypothetical protein